MMLNKFLVVFLLAIVSTRALPVQDDVSEQNTNKVEIINYRLPNDTAPIHYSIQLTSHLMEGRFTFGGRTSIILRVIKPTSVISLHSKDLTYVESATHLVRENGDTFVPEAHDYNQVTSILSIPFGISLEPGMYTLYMKYTGTLNDDPKGFYREAYQDQNGVQVWMASTYFQPVFARHAFPCWDEPAYKATFNISIKHSPKYTALSNMPMLEQSQVDPKDGKVWTNFQITPPMSTYLVAFVIADFKNISNGDGTINVWASSGVISSAKFIHEIAQKASAELERYTNSSALVPKMDLIGVQKQLTTDSNGWGLLIYQGRTFNFNEEKDTVYRKLMVGKAAVRELVHQWFGNVVSPSWWSHVWLNEGLASYFESYITDKIFKDWRVTESFVTMNMHQSLSQDGYSFDIPIDNYVQTPEGIRLLLSDLVCDKAASVLRMLSHVTSEDVFRNGILQYLTANRYGAADPDSLWKAIQSALDNSDIPHSNFNVKEVMDTWIKQTGYPLITVNRDYETGDTKVSQEDFSIIMKNYMLWNTGDGEENNTKSWWVPINYATEANPDFSNTLPTEWLEPGKNLTINGVNLDDWIILNKQQTGYYRVNYDKTNWKIIAKFLNTDDFTKIHVLNRAQIIDDALYFTLTSQMCPSDCFEILNYLSRETDVVAFFPIFKFINDMSNELKYPEMQHRLVPWILEKLGPLVESIGYTESPGDSDFTKLSRLFVLGVACKLGHTKCREKAAAQLAEHLRDPETHKVLPTSKWFVYCGGMMVANESTWDQLLALHSDESLNYTLDFLPCITDRDIIERYLNLSLAENATVTKDYQDKMFLRLLKTENLDTILDYVLQNWESISSSSRNMEDLVHTVAYRTVTKEQVDKVKEMLKLNNVDEAQITETVNNHLYVIDKMVEDIQKWNDGLNLEECSVK